MPIGDHWNEIGDPPMHFDRLGVPICMREWSGLCNDPEYCRIASSRVGPWWISTVWLGLFSNPWGPPLIFETMVFNSESGEPNSDWEMRRYPTEADARIGHAEMVHLVETLEHVAAEEWEPHGDA